MAFINLATAASFVSSPAVQLVGGSPIIMIYNYSRMCESSMGLFRIAALGYVAGCMLDEMSLELYVGVAFCHA